MRSRYLVGPTPVVVPDRGAVLRESRFETHPAEVVLSCADLDANVAFFTERLGFRIETVFPADDPTVTVVSGHGLHLRLVRGDDGRGTTLRLPSTASIDGADLGIAPNGTRVEFAPEETDVELPPVQPTLVVSRATDDAAWITGRAGMLYRDLIPGRLGGGFIASHIRIPTGGPVPDYVHFHRVLFQMIYCVRGWVRVVYEDQGPPFVLRAGDSVLQPPGIRHRVLECSDGLEVVEVSSPAQHETWADHELELPNETVRADRTFDGQRFVQHVAKTAPWTTTHDAAAESRDLQFDAATNGAARVRVLRLRAGSDAANLCHRDNLSFRFVLEGDVSFTVDGGEPDLLRSGDSLVVPRDTVHALRAGDHGVTLLEVGVPTRAAADS